MSHMFYRCKRFQSDLSSWNVGNVKMMNCMFRDCTSFESNVSHWNMTKVVDNFAMFRGCISMSLVYHARPCFDIETSALTEMDLDDEDNSDGGGSDMNVM